jgi:hypothetical protein
MEIKQENGRTIYSYSIKEKEDVDTMVSITYVGDLQDFLKINYLANEVSFIEHKLSKLKQAITELKPIVLFGDEPYYEEHMELMESEAIKTKEEIRNLYWWAVRYESFLNERLKEINKPDQDKIDKPKKLKKTLFEFIHNIEKKKAFLLELKKMFPTEIGKSIKAVIDILTKEKILIYGTKEFKLLFEELEKYFNRDIGSYNSVQNVKTVDAETTDIILKKLNPLIIKYKTT